VLPLVKQESRDGRGAILALDLGTHAGWAVSLENGSIRSGEWNLGRRSPSEGAGLRFLRFKQALIQFRKGTPHIGQVVYEEVMFSGGKFAQSQTAAQLFGGWRAILTSWCETHEIPYQGIHNATLKKYMLGKVHKVTKNDMIFAVKALGHAPATDNEADALGLLYVALGNEQAERLIGAQSQPATG
jgi:crossover junction endodeoxyribonuclease RuvC